MKSLLIVIAVAVGIVIAATGCESPRDIAKRKAKEAAVKLLRERAKKLLREQPAKQLQPAFVTPACTPGGHCPHCQLYGLADVPQNRRHHNYGGGSCVFAGIANVMEVFGRSDAADYLTHRYSGGEYAGGLNAKLDELGWDYVTITNGDERVLDWCDRTGRGAGVTFKANHFCSFLGWENGYAVILDSNHTDVYEFYPREEFLARWRSYGGWATAIVATPLPNL